MSHQKLLQLIGLALVGLISVGCAESLFKPSPTPTPTPAAGIGVPLSGGGWQVTIKDARHEAEVSRSGLTTMPGGGLGISMSTTNPPSGFIFLVVETTFHNLNPLAQSEVSAEDVTIIAENGKSYFADELSEPPREFVFTIEEDAINQVFELHFRDVPPIPFSVEQEADQALTTEIGAESGLLPYVCKFEDLSSLGDTGRLTFYRPEETGLVLGYVDPDGSNLTSVCSDIAFGELQLAADGAVLLLVTPPQGWPSLYLIEPEGEVYTLVNNGLNIEARFDPNGRWVLFATEKVGKTGRELYSFDRETVSITLVQAGEQVNFDFLTDGRLITNYRETEESDRQYYLGAPDGKALELLELPEKIAGYAFMSNNGQNLVYREVDASFSGFSLFISNLDGNNVQELAHSNGLRLDYALSPDGQAILMAIGEGERGDRVELRNLVSGGSWTIATGINEADFGFSADGQWATVVTTAGTQSTLYTIHTTEGSIRETKDAVNAFFSPNSAQLAYTVRQPDGSLEMYVTSLDGENAQSLGPGVVTGWFPLRVMP